AAGRDQVPRVGGTVWGHVARVAARVPADRTVRVLPHRHAGVVRQPLRFFPTRSAAGWLAEHLIRPENEFAGFQPVIAHGPWAIGTLPGGGIAVQYTSGLPPAGTGRVHLDESGALAWQRKRTKEALRRAGFGRDRPP